MNPPHRVVKVGGSLLERPDLGPRLRQWLDLDAGTRTLLVPGGGAAVDAVRRLDREQAIGDERAHWLAVQVLSLNALVLSRRLPASRVVTSIAECAQAWAENLTPILDPMPFLVEDDKSPDALPHSWDVTSDSIAARVALASGAAELVLLKSCEAQGADWEALARAGVVDAYFPRIARRLPGGCMVGKFIGPDPGETPSSPVDVGRSSPPP